MKQQRLRSDFTHICSAFCDLGPIFDHYPQIRDLLRGGNYGKSYGDGGRYVYDICILSVDIVKLCSFYWFWYILTK